MLTVSGTGFASLGRRDFLRVGTLGFAGLSLPTLLRADAESKQTPRSVIYIVLSGGPSHIDMWDLKPQAPLEYRGPFRPIPTRLPGVHLCEHMPLQAGMMHQLALLRGIRSVENDHYLSEVYTGLPRTAGNRPAFGSVVSRLAGGVGAMPPYVSLSRATSDPFEYEKPFFAGPQHAPFRPFEQSLRDLKPSFPTEVLNDRRALLERFDQLKRDMDRPDSPATLDRFHAQAVEILTSARVRDAFDLSREPLRVREAYGSGKFRYTHQTVRELHYPWPSDQFLLARRLVEAGARVVTLRPGDWDHHSGATSDIFYSLKLLMPALDRSLHALCTDLRDRGLDEEVLVVVLGEFGRTPKISQPGPGREHWADAGCAVLCGGGLRMGQVVGETDSRGEQSRSGTMTFQNVLATIYKVLGIDPAQTIPDYNGRPQYLLDDREPIRELFS